MYTQRIEVLPKDFISEVSDLVHYDQSFSSFYIITSKREIPMEILEEVFCNPLTQKVNISNDIPLDGVEIVIETSFLKGVTDNVANTSVEALKLFGHDAIINSGKLYFLKSSKDCTTIREECKQVLYNPLINDVEVLTTSEFLSKSRFNVNEAKIVNPRLTNSVEVISLDITDQELEELSTSRCLALTLQEMKSIRDYYIEIATQRLAEGFPKWPTDVELECLAQTWSEHCKHKTFSATINFKNEVTRTHERIDSVFKTFIRSTTEEIRKNRKLDWLISVFHDNAGIIRFDKNIDLCFKVETHNSPSALDPYGGALTGILGVNRDILGCGIGAKPIANTNVFCLGAPGLFDTIPQSECPRDLISPEDILAGIHKGVEDGGNKSGVPTINGAMSFHDSYAGKPLVYVGSLGFMPQTIDGRDTAIKEINEGDFIYVAGGKVGSDGIHGATFSSMDLNESSPTNAVQIGDPITQKRLMDFLLEARDLGLITAITDNGAGGISSSIGEMAELSNGATIYLDKVPLKYAGLRPWEILVSESQERMSFAISESNSNEFEELAERRGVEVSNIGVFESTGKLKVFANSECCASLDLEFLHNGLPDMKLHSVWNGPTDYHNPFRKTLKSASGDGSLSHILKTIISHGDVASKEEWARKYDHEVGGNTALRPFESKDLSAVNNCGIISLEKLGGEKDNAVALGLGLASRVSPYDPYLMAKLSVDESIRNIVCQGADPKYIAVLDNFCWPDSIESSTNPDGAYKLAQLVLASKGLRDACLSYGTPLISGKDSMKNDYRGKNNKSEDIKISVLPTLLVSSIGKVNTNHIISASLQEDGDIVLLIGSNLGGLIGSIYGEYFTHEKSLPKCSLKDNYKTFNKIHSLIKNDLVNHCSDISDGGLLSALSEQCFLNKKGIYLTGSFSEEELFNESGGRFIISCSRDSLDRVKEALEDTCYQELGVVNSNFTIDCNSQVIDLKEMYLAWDKGVKNFHKELSYER